MSLLADAWQASFAPSLYEVRGFAGRETLPDLIISKKVGYYIDIDSASKEVRLAFASPLVAKPLSADCCRLACASFQTMMSLPDQSAGKTAIPWLLIKTYYASFYAAHAIIRIFGESCSFLSGAHTGYITRLYLNSGRALPFTLEQGTYSCRVASDSTALTCLRLDSGSGGAHESFWNVFGQRIGDLAGIALRAGLSTIEAQSVFRQIDRLIDTLKIGGGGFNWMSRVRNEVQYRQSMDAWVPSAMKKKEQREIFENTRLWLSDPMLIDLEARQYTLSKFVAAGNLIVSICRELLLRAAERGGAKFFAHSGPLALLREAGLSV